MNNRHQPITDRLAALNQQQAYANQRRHGAVGVLTPATTTTEQAHAQHITDSAATMRGKGYSISALKALDGVLDTLLVIGPKRLAYEAAEIIQECPPYVCLADYLLARYEQDAE